MSNFELDTPLETIDCYQFYGSCLDTKQSRRYKIGEFVWAETKNSLCVFQIRAVVCVLENTEQEPVKCIFGLFYRYESRHQHLHLVAIIHYHPS